MSILPELMLQMTEYTELAYPALGAKAGYTLHKLAVHRMANAEGQTTIHTHIHGQFQVPN